MHNFSNFKIRTDISTLSPYSIFISMQHNLCITEITEDPASQRYDISGKEGSQNWEWNKGTASSQLKKLKTPVCAERTKFLLCSVNSQYFSLVCQFFSLFIPGPDPHWGVTRNPWVLGFSGLLWVWWLHYSSTQGSGLRITLLPKLVTISGSPLIPLPLISLVNSGLSELFSLPEMLIIFKNALSW